MDAVALISGLTFSSLSRVFLSRYQSAEAEKKSYLDKLEGASGEDVFKYLLLIDVAALDSYTTQTRLQAEQSFSLSKLVGLLGFILLAVAIGFGIYSQLFLPRGLQIAYVAAAGGVLTEFISGIFFYLYTSTLKQINLFYKVLQQSRRISTGLMLAELVKDEAAKEAARVAMARGLVGSDEANSTDPVVAQDQLSSHKKGPRAEARKAAAKN